MKGAQDIADAFGQMHEKRRYHEILFMIDTCQAASMYSRIYSPNILSASSSQTGESSYSHHLDYDLGVAVIDRFTYYNLETLERLHRDHQETLKNLVIEIIIFSLIVIMLLICILLQESALN
jgi:phosphatidylinositol glycan class K